MKTKMHDRKEFARDDRGYVLMGDALDVSAPYNKRQEIYEWCGANKITIEYQGTLAGTDVWRIRDEEQRMWFTLRWAA